MSVLVVFYSLSGNSKKVAEKVAELTGCDIVEIKEKVSRKGVFGFLKSGYEAITKKSLPIEDIDINFKKYDKVIVVCPIWASNLPSPVRSFLKRYLDSIKDIGFIFTLASDEDVKVDKVFEKDFNKKVFGSLSICSKKIKSEEFENEIKDFIKNVQVN